MDRARVTGCLLAVIVLATTATPAAFAGNLSPDGTRTLNGGWVRTVGPAGGAGLPDGRFTGQAVKLPDVANAAFTDLATMRAAQRGAVAWYRRTFTVPAGGDWRLTFGSANFTATVWLDGRRLGTHTGAYAPFAFTRRLVAGRRHTVVVRTDYRDPARQDALGFHRAWFNWGGLNGTVTLRPLGLCDLELPVVTTRLSGTGADVTIGVTVRNRSSRELTLRPLGLLAGVPFRFAPARAAPRRSLRVRARLRVVRSDLWSPQRPRMQALRIVVPGGCARRDEVGLRELRVAHGRMLVNGRPLWLRGAALQEEAPGRGDALTGADQDRIVAELRAIGANATRAQHALDPGLLDRLDRAGILVWQGAGPFESPGRWTIGTSAAGQAAARARALRQVALERIHPSIVAWSLVNELAGNGADRSQIDYVDGLARELHRLDPGRLVAVDIWGAAPPAVPGPIYRNLDAVGLTDYSGWAQAPGAPRGVRDELTRKLVARFARQFPGKLRVITEFGAAAGDRNPGDAPGGYGYQAELIADHARIYRADPGIGGALVWNLTDFSVPPNWGGGTAARLYPRLVTTRGRNEKGLFTADGRPKPAAQRLARFWRR